MIDVVTLHRVNKKIENMFIYYKYFLYICICYMSHSQTKAINLIALNINN